MEPTSLRKGRPHHTPHENLLEQFDKEKNVTVVNETDIQTWIRLRDLKTQPDIELVHVQEIIQWYLDDIGVMTMWVNAGETYQIDYSHKIASDSCLFLPTRIPTLVQTISPEMDYQLWTIDAFLVDIPNYLHKESSSNKVDHFTFGEWGWDYDTRINTNNWESSDDEFESDED